MVEAIRVVTVDDEPGLADVTADFLERADDRLAVEATSGAEEALEVLAASTVDCIVSDYDMPRTDGIELLEAVRAEHPDLPFILFTGKGSEEIASEAITAGVTDYLQKEGGTDQYDILANRIVNAVEGARAQSAVRRLQRLSEAFPDVLLHIDGDGRYLNVLAGGVKLVRYDDPAELVGNRFHDIHDDETADRFLATVREATDTGETQTIEYDIELDSGRRWFEARVVPLPATSSDREDEVIWASRDVTERVEQARNLQRYRSLVDAMEDPVCIYDEAGRYVLVNQHLAEGYGSTPGEMAGEESKLVARIRQEAGGDPYRELLDGERDELKGEYPSNLSDREMMEYRLTRLVIDGTCEGVVSVSRDISERKARERELERTNARLEEFASVVSHDLRNPLTVAAGRLELAREARDDPHLDEVATALGRMDALVDDILTLAREGEEVGEVEPVDLHDVVETSWGNVATGDTTVVAETGGTVLADPGRLQQLLENLFRNAVEHGGEDVTVRVGDLDGGFFVEDDGPGVPDDERDRVFESGYTTSDQGTGFGLSTVQQIVEAHDWEVAVVEGEGGGARFEVTGVGFA